jgi:hypothetical protein
VEGKDIAKERPVKQWSEVEGKDMVEDMTAAVEVVEREHVLWCWRSIRDDGAERH